MLAEQNVYSTGNQRVRRIAIHALVLFLTILGGPAPGLLLGTAAAADQPAPPRILIIDSSGSMAGKIENQVKLDIARDVASREIASWPSDQRFAVMAYGHRRKGDCEDIEVLRPIGTTGGKTLQTELRGLRPLGKTPLSRSLQTAATLLDPKDGGEIILVSDGIETCGKDPCALAEALRKANARLRIHVVSFAANQEEKAPLACIAEKGGGVYADAGSTQELTKALKDVEKKIVSEPPPAIPPPAPAPPPPEEKPAPAAPPQQAAPSPSPPSEKLIHFFLTGGPGNLLSEAPANWRIATTDGEVLLQAQTRVADLKLKPGSYTVEASISNASVKTGVEVTDATNSDFPIKLDAGRLNLSATRSSKDGKIADGDVQAMRWSIVPLDGQGAVETPQIAAPAVLVAPGRYRISVAAFGTDVSRETAITAGEDKSLALNLALGKVKLAAQLEGNSSPIESNAGMDWKLNRPEGASAAAVATAQPSFTLPAGTYAAELTIDGQHFSDQVTIADGDDREQIVKLPASRLQLTARLGSNGPIIDKWQLTNWSWKRASETDFNDSQTLIEPTPEIVVMPGRWTIRLKSGLTEAVREVDAKPGETQPVVVDVDGGLVTLTGIPRSPQNVYIRVVRDGDDPKSGPALVEVGTGDDGAHETLLPSGKYRATMKTSDGEARDKAFEVIAGSQQTITIELP